MFAICPLSSSIELGGKEDPQLYDLNTSNEERKLNLNEPKENKGEAYENIRLSKETAKIFRESW